MESNLKKEIHTSFAKRTKLSRETFPTPTSSFRQLNAAEALIPSLQPKGD
jgi:hypothetical protein